MSSKNNPYIGGTQNDTFGIGNVKGGKRLTIDASTLTADRLAVWPDSDGSNGYALTTDGAGVLSWSAASGFVPYFIPSGNTFTIPLYQQALFNITIDNEGTIDNNGILVYVG